MLIQIFRQGVIEKEGTFDDLVNSDHPYSKLLTAEPQKEEVQQLEQQDPEKEQQIVKLKRQISRRVGLLGN